MIFYKDEKKKLVIPSGFVMIPIDCDEAIEQAREDGYREGFADGSSATCDTEEGTYSLTDDFDGEETVFPSEGKTGFNKIVIVDDGYGDAKYDEGYADGIADCSGSTPCDCSSAVTEAYQSGYTEGYNQGQADCPECSGGTCNLRNGRVELYRDWDGDDTIYPGEGYDGFSSIQITDNGYGNKMYQSGYTQGYNDGQGGGCNLQDKSVYQNTNLATYYPDEGYDGMRSIYVDATGAYSNGHTDGQNYARSLMVSSAFTENGTYTRAEGWNSITVNVQQSDCSSAITEAYQSGYTEGYTQGQADCSGGTCPTETGLISLDSGWSGYESYQPIGSGYFDEVIITDAGYGQAKFDQGYELGLATCSASSGSCLIEDEQTASLGYDWTGFTIVYPSQGYDGLGRVLVADLGYGQSKYDEGYNDGQASCSAATEEAYESGVTEERGNIYAVKIKVTPTSQNWSWTQFGTPHKLTATDASGNNYVFNINYVIYDGYSWDEDAGQTHIDYEFLGRFETTGGTPVKYLTPAQLTIEVPSQDYNNWGSNIGIEVFFNGEMIPAQYEGETLPPYAFDLENGFKYTATSYSVGYNAVDSRCFQLIINL